MIKKIIVPNWCIYFSFFLYGSFFTICLFSYLMDFYIPKAVSLIYFILIIFNFSYSLHLEQGKKVNLYEIYEFIKVNGSKVVIDKLPQGYKYVNKNINKYKQQNFKLEYDSFYESVTLVNNNGEVIKLSKEDYKFLESINSEL